MNDPGGLPKAGFWQSRKKLKTIKNRHSGQTEKSIFWTLRNFSLPDEYLLTLISPHDGVIECAFKLDPVWPKKSCGPLVVIFKHPSKSLSKCNRAVTPWSRLFRGKYQHILSSLVVALFVIVLGIFSYGMPESSFSEKNYVRQALFLDGPDPSLGVRV